MSQAQNISSKDVLKFKAAGSIHYSDFGAKGDGKTDDIDAIAATHEFANLHGLLVKADNGATYYIGGKERTVVIQTDTDFGTAAFIIDDTKVKNRDAAVFTVSSTLKSFKLKTISSLKRNQEKINTPLPGPCLITVTNSNVKQYIRFGLNQNNGSSQTDIFLTDKNGNVDMNAPIIWDFVPAGGKPISTSLINGSNSGQHDFGYTCYMPEKITIENLRIDDTNHPDNYQGPAIFANFNPKMTDDSYQEKFPYIKTKEVILKNVTTASGKKLRVSDNPFMFKNVKVNTN